MTVAATVMEMPDTALGQAVTMAAAQTPRQASIRTVVTVGRSCVLELGHRTCGHVTALSSFFEQALPCNLTQAKLCCLPQPFLARLKTHVSHERKSTQALTQQQYRHVESGGRCRFY